jgi:hypothetical protein
MRRAAPGATTVGAVPQLPDTAGSARARMRLIAVLLLGLVTAYWAVLAVWLLFLPEGMQGATAAVVMGALSLVWAGLNGLATWGVFARRRGLHFVAIVVAALGLLQPASDVTYWLSWLLFTVSLATVALLAATIPRGVAKA